MSCTSFAYLVVAGSIGIVATVTGIIGALLIVSKKKDKIYSVIGKGLIGSTVFIVLLLALVAIMLFFLNPFPGCFIG